MYTREEGTRTKPPTLLTWILSYSVTVGIGIRFSSLSQSSRWLLKISFRCIYPSAIHPNKFMKTWQDLLEVFEDFKSLTFLYSQAIGFMLWGINRAIQRQKQNKNTSLTSLTNLTFSDCRAIGSMLWGSNRVSKGEEQRATFNGKCKMGHTVVNHFNCCKYKDKYNPVGE